MQERTKGTLGRTRRITKTLTVLEDSSTRVLVCKMNRVVSIVAQFLRAVFTHWVWWLVNAFIFFLGKDHIQNITFRRRDDNKVLQNVRF
jgi:hypothetical protein